MDNDREDLDRSSWRELVHLIYGETTDSRLSEYLVPITLKRADAERLLAQSLDRLIEIFEVPIDFGEIMRQERQMTMSGTLSEYKNNPQPSHYYAAWKEGSAVYVYVMEEHFKINVGMREPITRMMTSPELAGRATFTLFNADGQYQNFPFDTTKNVMIPKNEILETIYTVKLTPIKS